MNSNENVEYIDHTYCARASEPMQNDYLELFGIIQHKIFLHRNKEELLNYSSIDRYLQRLSNVEMLSESLQDKLQMCINQLLLIRQEIYDGKDTVTSPDDMQINFDTLTQDQNELRKIHTGVIDDWKINLPDTELTGMADDISESLFTNADFQYSDSNIFDKPIIPSSSKSDYFIAANPIENNLFTSKVAHSTSESLFTNIDSQCSGSKVDVKDPRINRLIAEQIVEIKSSSSPASPLKKRKIDDAELYDEKSNPTQSQLNSVKCNIQTEPTEYLERRKLVFEALESMDLPKIHTAKGNIFDDPEIVKAYTSRLDSLINSFKISCNEGFDELIEEAKRKETEKPSKKKQKEINPFSYKKGDPLPVKAEEERNKMDEDVSLEELSVIFTDMYKNLQD